MKYTVQHRCGHQSVVDLIGKGRDRQWRLQRLEKTLCPDCEREERRQRNQEDAAENVKAGLPQLTGTENQVLWAESIRRQVYVEIESMYEKNLLHESVRPLSDALFSITAASWWIDRRHLSSMALIDEVEKELAKGNIRVRREETPEEEQAKIEAMAEATVRPEKPVTETVAEIRIVSNTIEVDFPEKRESFRTLIRFELGFAWSPTASVWRRAIGKFNGTVEDRLVETGHRLLAAGFPVRIYDPELRRRAIDGEFEPEIKRWVKRLLAGKHVDWFSITWPKGEDYYKVAKRIPGARWSPDDQAVVVPAEQWNEVLDFAERYGFGLSPGAQELVEQARRIKEAALVASVNPKCEEVVKPSTKPPTLEVPSEVEIDDELRDDA